MKNISWTKSTALFLLGAILFISSLINIFYAHHYLIAAFMMLAAFCNFADGMRLRNNKK